MAFGVLSSYCNETTVTYSVSSFLFCSHKVMHYGLSHSEVNDITKKKKTFFFYCHCRFHSFLVKRNKIFCVKMTDKYRNYKDNNETDKT